MMARNINRLALLLSVIPSSFGWTSSSSSRRELLENVAVGCGGIFLGQAPAAWALEDVDSPPPTDAPTSTAKKPFAPIEQLLPAARVKWTIDKAVQIAQAPSTDWNQLQTLLLIPQNYTDNRLPDVPTAPAKAYMDTYQRNREQLNVLEKPGAMMVQSGEIAAWKRLKRQERVNEKQDEIRAALNLYTTSLSFSSDSYLLNVPLAERKEMIRQDRLPDVKQVIQSDMGVRYLIRNELLTTMDEVRGELEYQVGSSKEEASNEELLALLQKAQSACDQWFALIDERDVVEAMKLVRMEKAGA